MAYIQKIDPNSPPGLSEPMEDRSCFLCEASGVSIPSDQARESHVLLRDQRGVILLNLYPYTNGHLLVAPAEHVADLHEFSARQRGDLMELTAVAEQLLKTAINPQGFNIGINIGRCAGAGVPGHLHVHVVPRWSGDTNFTQTVGHVRVVPEAIEESYARLAKTLETMKKS